MVEWLELEPAAVVILKMVGIYVGGGIILYGLIDWFSK